jgi:4-hydroxy-3-methylbut-2-enyl diphosphate reductase
VELEKGVEGVIKISDISYFRIETPDEFFKENEKIEAVILSDTLDSNYKIKLGTKQLSDSEWKDFFSNNKPKTIINVKIKKVNEKGIVVEITKNIEGFVRINEVDEKRLTPEEIEKKYKPDETREALILQTEPDKKRVYLSFKAVDRKKEREEIEKYSKSESDSITTIGDLFENAIDKNK